MDLKTTPRATSQIPRLEGNQNSVGKGNWNQMWPAEPRKNESKEEVTGKRVETTISRQFLPKKKQGVSEAWSKQTLENREDLKQPFPYTPFKSGTLKKATSINTLRGSAFNSHFNQDVSQIYGTQQQSCKLRTVPNVQETMRAHYDANNIYSNFMISALAKSKRELCIYKGLFVVGNQCTSGILHQESKGMWKGAPSGMTAPPSGPYRPASVINAPLLARPSSRANSDLGIGAVLLHKLYDNE
ncbi:unnamed protein product [Thelazia callipaeda]|uniref:Uncharacterized protein n=1 Tax=Thelazia callipaeda TaxID=103827 RepID=A0A0N5CRG7_THECL|nr:unnamed protein product [Thelazia callipaeda]